MSNRLKGSKRDEFERNFNERRKELNESLLQLHIKMLQPKAHFFDRLKERKISEQSAFDCIVKTLRTYNKRLSTIKETTSVTLRVGQVVIAAIAEPSFNRVAGHHDDGLPTVCIMPMTVYTENGLLKNKQYDNLLAL